MLMSLFSRRACLFFLLIVLYPALVFLPAEKSRHAQLY